MQLWACGFNAWGQLQFADNKHAECLNSDGTTQQPTLNDLPKDLEKFECVLVDPNIEVLKTSHSATIIRQSSQLVQTGSPDHFFQYLKSEDCQVPNEHIAQTLSEKVAAFKSDTLSTYESLDKYKSGIPIIIDSTAVEDVKNVIANDTSFYALTKSGKVLSWGDVRHQNSLGREVNEDSPADVPCVIEDLASDPITGIKKISAGGYIAGALTNENDLYVWGGRQGQETPLPDMSGIPDSVDIEGEDILDFGVGDRHIVVLTMSHRLWVIGNNSNGQCGDGSNNEIGAWKEVILPLDKGQKIVKVYGGYKTSFAIVDGEAE
ncbi:E3 ubiquitin-protein ligase [Lachnellula occidentalis]|uniref:E3 ubiquitin-protein ligase n=1 Tax=Lachnellula occidentalis TaxID=215460 RepID=A0A8H8UJ13_9HELO|nr:E3 ubiquitin-protein ligase [Lachnellula occidentalis]